MKNDFSNLKIKIFLRVLLIGIISIAAGLFTEKVLIDGVLQDPFAVGFINFSINTLHLNKETSISLYEGLFRQNKDLWLLVGLFVLLLIIFYQSLSKFIKYFNEVSAGMDKLIEESDNEIVLSPEMDFMEVKLNKIKTALKKREKAAQEAEQRKNDLVVYLAHDIKTPLTSVIGYLNLLDEAPDMPQEQKAKYTGITLEKAYRLEQLINEFFEITRFNLQTIILDKEEINLPFMLMQMADEFYPILEPQGMKVEVVAEEGLVINGDANKLARVFNNILKNAIAYSYKNSTIKISAKQQNTNIVITFANQGNPIPKSKLDVIFERFYRLDTARSTNTGGAGLGLAIAKEIVTAHGGIIIAESDHKLTAFTITLPKN